MVAEIEHAIENRHEEITAGDEVRYVIGEHPTQSKAIVLRIAGGSIISAELAQQEEEAVEDEIEDETDEDQEVPVDPVDEIDGEDDRSRTIFNAKLAAKTALRIVSWSLRGWSLYTSLERIDDMPTECGLSADDIEMTVDSESAGTFDRGIGYEEFQGQFERTENPVKTELRCALDRESFIEAYSDSPEEFKDGNPDGSSGERISYELMNERGLDVVWSEDGYSEGDADEKGPDAIAYDEDADEYVIVEAKTTTYTDAVGYSLLSTTAYDGDAQLHNDWIENSLLYLVDNGRIDTELATDVIDEVQNNNTRKEVVFVRDVEESSHRTLTKPKYDSTDISISGTAGVDKVTIIELHAAEQMEFTGS